MRAGSAAARPGFKNLQDSSHPARFPAAHAQLVVRCRHPGAIFRYHSKELGNEFRLDVFSHQFDILPNTLHAFAEKFAAEHKVSLPFVVDPDGKLTALMKADKDLGISLKIQHTPTIYIVSNKKGGKPYVEVTDTSQLYVMIDAMK